MQAVDIIQAALTGDEFRGYLKGCALKYRLRLGDKDAIGQDLAKSNAYRAMLATGIRPDGRGLRKHPMEVPAFSRPRDCDDTICEDPSA